MKDKVLFCKKYLQVNCNDNIFHCEILFQVTNLIITFPCCLLLKITLMTILATFGSSATFFLLSLALFGSYHKQNLKLGEILNTNTRDGNPNPTNFLDPERIRIQIRNLNCGFGLLIFTTFVKKNDFHSILHVYLGLRQFK